MKRSVRWGAAAAALVIGAAGAGWLGRRLNRSRAEKTDSEISAGVWSLLGAEFGPKAEDFSVSVQNGSVTLRGDVPTLDDIRRLGAEAGAVEGVVNVTNLLRLQASRRVLHGESTEAGVWLS